MPKGARMLVSILITFLVVVLVLYLVNMLPIEGLYTAGEMLGGLFYFNYPSGTGLISGG